ncbi:MAG: nuclear transport factor 2 family protein [Flavobacteriaceae bacterium]
MKNLINALFLMLVSSTYAQEITGHVRTSDKYSEAVKSTIKEYLDNTFTTFDQVYADDVTFNLNGNNADKAAVRQGWTAHHSIYRDIKIEWMFVETTMYDENNNNMVWSHLWGQWTGTSNRTGKEWSNPFHASFKWVDGKIVNSNWIYDPTSENQEMAAMKK